MAPPVPCPHSPPAPVEGPARAGEAAVGQHRRHELQQEPGGLEVRPRVEVPRVGHRRPALAERRRRAALGDGAEGWASLLSLTAPLSGCSGSEHNVFQARPFVVVKPHGIRYDAD